MSVAEPIAATLPPTGSHSASPAPSGSRRLGGQFSIDLSIILVTFNSWSYVQRCLQLLPSACSGAMSEIIVIDNGSRDGTPERILQEFPDVTVVRLAQNVGFAAANNRGMIASRGRHVLLLNSDTEPAPESLTQLVKFLDDHLHVGIVAPRLLNTDGTDQGTARSFSGPLDAVLGRTSLVTKWFPNNLRARRTLYSRWHTDADPFPVDQVSGACLLARREAITYVGLLDESFFFYWEDGDWCRRFKLLGWEVWCLPAAKVIHHEHKSSSGQSVRLVIQFHRSVYRYYCKHHAPFPVHPLRLVAAVGLSGRTGVILGSRLLRRIASGSERSTRR